MPKADTLKRSRKGCTECRKRKIKCDERSPTCGQCRKAGRDCPIVDSVFRLHPYTFTVQPEAFTWNSAPRPKPRPEPEPVEQPAAISAQDVPQQQQQQPQPAPPAVGELMQVSHSPKETQQQQQQQPPGNAPAPAPFTPTTPARNWLAISNLTQPLSASPPVIPPSLPSASLPDVSMPDQMPVEPAPVIDSPQSHRFAPPSTASPQTSYLHSLRLPEDPQEANEVTFFLRQYCEGLGRSIDMFGRDQCFGRLTTARQSDLIKFAACAAAAKQLGHMKDPNSHARPTAARQAVMTALIAHGRDFLWYGAKYYGKSIQAMAADLLQDATSPNFDLATSDFAWAVPSPNSVSSGVGQETEHRLLAACIMCQYEHLSASTRAWAGHLNGIYKLLRLDRADAMVIDGAEPSVPSPAFQPGSSLRGLFWFFVRNDIEESFVSGKETRVDTDNNALWRTMGLPLDHSGRFSGGSLAADGNTEPVESHVVVLNAMTRLLCKVISLISITARPQGITRRGGNTGTEARFERTARWTSVNDELDLWLEALPSSFQSDTIRRRGTSTTQTRATPSEIFEHEVWFADSTCAMSILYYHMARILMLTNKPVDLLLASGYPEPQPQTLPVTVRPTDWLVVSRNLQKQLSQHAKSMVAIALGLPEDGVRMHMLQPLYVAGRCLTNEADQRMLIELLECVENDLGVATGYRVTALIQEWGTSSLTGNSMLDRELSDLSSPAAD